MCKFMAGNTVMLWCDKWNGKTLMNTFPQLFSFAKDKHITVAGAHHTMTSDMYDMFDLPMSSIAVEQSYNVHILINQTINANHNNKWNFYWSDKVYSNKRIYLELIANPPDAAKPFQWIWKSSCLPKQKQNLVASLAGQIEHKGSAYQEKLLH